jgi:hypothetical protein
VTTVTYYMEPLLLSFVATHKGVIVRNGINGFKIKRFDPSPSERLAIWYILTWPLRHYLPSKSLQPPNDQVTPQKHTASPDTASAVDESCNNSWLNDYPAFPPSEHSDCLLEQLRDFINRESNSLFCSIKDDFPPFFIFSYRTTEESWNFSLVEAYQALCAARFSQKSDSGPEDGAHREAKHEL